MYRNNKHTGYFSDKFIFSLPKYPFDYVYLTYLLKEYRNPRNKIGLMLKKGQIIRLKKGIYILSPDYGGRINKFNLANVIYGPSYISFESALSYWGLIPERVNIVTSATTKRKKIFKTALGTFIYSYLHPSRYIHGYTMVNYNDISTILIAKKEKAMCDILYTSQIHSLKSMEAYLFDDIRIDPDDLKDFDPDLLKVLAEQHKNSSVTLFYKWYRKCNKSKRI